jgi:hypothetical protein
VALLWKEVPRLVRQVKGRDWGMCAMRVIVGNRACGMTVRGRKGAIPCGLEAFGRIVGDSEMEMEIEHEHDLDPPDWGNAEGKGMPDVDIGN